MSTGATYRLLDTDTAKAAGRAMTADPERLNNLQQQVLLNLWRARVGLHVGLTDHEHGFLQTSAGKRRKELQNAGLVEDSGHRRPSPSGRNCIVWQITDAGITAAWPRNKR